MKKEVGLNLLRLFLKFIIVLIVSSELFYAKGTHAGTDINNQASIHYAILGVDRNITSNINSFVVDKVVDLDLSWQDNAPVEVGIGEHNMVLRFILTNLGNSKDHFKLSYDHNSSSDFTPSSPTIHIDTNGNGIYDVGTDLVVGDLNLTADTNTTLFIVSNIPTDANTSGISRDDIKAISTSIASTGADHPNQVDTVVRKGADVAEGIYKIRDYFLLSRKSAKIHSDDNATHTGTIITYIIDLGVGGNSAGKSITNVKLKDNIPVGTKYVAGSLRLDDTSLSDPADSDAGSFDGNAVHVTVGTISGVMHKKVKFDVRVQ